MARFLEELKMCLGPGIGMLAGRLPGKHPSVSGLGEAQGPPAQSELLAPRTVLWSRGAEHADPPCVVPTALRELGALSAPLGQGL